MKRGVHHGGGSAAEPAAPGPGAAAVVGAGIAGISAARRLRDLGRQVRLVDKARGMGGRCSTRRVGKLSFDHGAQYFTARELPLSEAIDPLVQQGQVQRWEPCVVRIAADGSRSVARDSDRYVGVPGMSALAGGLGAALDAELNAQVRSLERDRSGHWTLTVDDGRQLGPFGAVIVTCPAPQAAVLLGGVAPGLAEACRSVELLPCWSTMVAFDQPVDFDLDAAFIDDELLAWIARESSKPGRPRIPECWTLHAGPAWSIEHLEVDAGEVAQHMLDRFSRLTGGRPGSPIHLEAHRWRFARSASPGTLHPGLIEPKARIAVAGDWTRGDRIEGAYTSGHEVAGEIARLLDA